MRECAGEGAAGKGIEGESKARPGAVYLSYKWLIYLTISAAWSAMTANEASGLSLLLSLNLLLSLSSVVIILIIISSEVIVTALLSLIRLNVC